MVFSDNFCAVTESDLFVMDANGGAITQITDTPENELSKSWSPDGSRVAAALAENVQPSGVSKGDIAVIDAATGATVNLTNTTNASEGDPDWSPH
jgi:Tol biopolymer transport system component